MSLESLLAILADGKIHSGDELGEVLGVSRTAIWKKLKRIPELGLHLESIKGRGYCIPGGLDLLSRSKVESELLQKTKSFISALDIKQIVDSTNTVAMARATVGDKGYVCAAEQQSAGKGRRGKAWVSPYGCNLYLSVVWEFTGGAAALEGLSLAVGVAVTSALEKAGVLGVKLKWPNDLLYDNRKLSGILLEMVGDAAGRCHVVVGIGLNVAMSNVTMPNIDQPWVDVKSINPGSVDRNRLLVLLLDELMPMLASFEQLGFEGCRERWLELDAYAGREVSILLGDQVVLGKAAGVDKTGAIMLETPFGVRTFNGGEISLRVVE